MRYKRRLSPPVCSIEHLEARHLLSAVTVALQPVVVSETEANDTLDRANDLGILEGTQVHGDLDASGTDVDWYEFQLSTPSTVTVSSTAGTIGLYNNSHGDIADLRDLIGYRLLAQDGTAETSGGQITRDLAAGIYYVAVSGAGNRYFSPFIADSGLPAAAGSYQLDLTCTPLDLSNSADPQTLAVDASALVVRIDLSEALDFAPTIELTTSGGADLPLLWTNQNTAIAELQLAPATPLVPGDYTAVIKDADGHVRLTVAVHVADEAAGGVVDQGNDTPATAMELGNIEQQGLVQITGAIGDDAYYDFSSLAPAFQPGNDVDLYHFSVTSDTPVGFQAEVFAGRISSPLDAGISLYRLNPVSGHLEFVTGNNQSYNPTRATDRKSTLYFDPALMTALTAGEYYVAVSQGYNTPSPDEFQPGGEESGIFNPEVSHSGSVGESVGAYVLNLQIVAIPNPPEVNSVSIVDQSTLTSAPTAFTVDFSEYMNLTSLAFRAFQETSQSSIAGVYIVDPQGQKTFPRLTAFDVNTFSASFKMLDRLDSGTYELHLSGSLGLTNVAGAPLIGNTLDGDYVVRFTVDAAEHGTEGNPLVLTHVEVPGQDDVPQSLGVLFPHELQAGVTIVRDGGAAGSREEDVSDKYQFEILQQQTYFLFLDGNRLPDGVTMTLFDSRGAPVNVIGFLDGRRLSVDLQPGTYVLQVGDWPDNRARRLEYQIAFNLTGISDDSPPLFSGPGPAIGIRLATTISPNGGQSGSGNPLPGSGGSIGSGGGGSSSGGNGSISGSGLSSDRPANLDLNGLPQISLPSGLGNLAISIPALNYSAGDRVGSIRTAGGSLRQSAGLNAGPRFSSLIRLADGPVGAVGAGSDDISITMRAMQNLNTLIGARLSTNSSLARDDQSAETTDRGADNAPPAHEADQANAETSNSEESLSTTEEEVKSQSQATRDGDPAKSVSVIEQAWPMLLAAEFADDGTVRHGENDSAFISAEPELSAESALTSVRAVGIGAFVLQVASLQMQHLTTRWWPSKVFSRRARNPHQRLIK